MKFKSMNISATISKQTGEAIKDNTLAFCVDDNYLPYALFVVEQFINLHPEIPCDICICMPDISKVPERFLNGQIRFIELTIQGIDTMPVGSLSLAAYYRLFLPQVFKDVYQYIIYLDADTYINRSFYNEMISCINSFPTNFCVAAAADITELKLKSHLKKKAKKVDIYVSSYHKFNHIYRNSGVLLLHTKNYNEKDILNKIFTYAFENTEKLQCHDQSALNGTLLNDIALLPFNFNWQIHTLTYKLTQSVNPYIIHFISDNKPWILKNKFTSNYQSIYKDFLKKNFPNIIPQVLDVYEHRRKTPKYSNSAREFLSIKGHQLRDNLSTISKNLTFYPKNDYGIQKILTTMPFLVSSTLKSEEFSTSNSTATQEFNSDNK